MYTVILVDDERPLCESIRDLVPWEENGFQLIGVAENGLDALQLMEEAGVPDLLITDIKMPVMDGLELVKRVKQEHPTIKVVLLSGYDEFQYAVAGIELNVFQYLLKPVSEPEIVEMLQNVERQITQEIQEANDLALVKKEYFEQIEVMKISFLISLLTETYTNVSKQELEDFIQTYDLDFLHKEKVLFTVQLKHEIRDQKLIRFSLSNMVRTIVTKYIQAEVFLFSSTIVCLLPVGSQLTTVVNEIIESAKKLLNQDVLIGVSEPYNDVFNTKKAYRQAMEALDYARFNDKGNIIHVTDIEARMNHSDVFADLDEYTLQLALKTGDETTVDTLVKTALQNNAARAKSINVAASVVYSTAMRALYDSGAEIQDAHTNWYHTFLERSQYQSRPAMIAEIGAFCRSIMQEIRNLRNQHTNSMVAKSIKYMEENFNNPEISLQTVSEHIALSPTYFSAVFKKETGQSFIEMLTKMRMNRAKELVLTTKEKMFEIALACGYNDQHYFSYSFKKYFGKSPTKMRRELEES